MNLKQLDHLPVGAEEEKKIVTKRKPYRCIVLAFWMTQKVSCIAALYDYPNAFLCALYYEDKCLKI
jgi:hypothetical protein